MISVDDATKLVLSNKRDFGTESVPLTQAMGRVLQETLVADRDFPPFNRVAMDGIAIDFSHFERGQRQFTVQGLAAAGSPQLTLTTPSACLEVMTGCILPDGTDTVIRYEDVEVMEGVATIKEEAITKGQNIHFKALDRHTGDKIVYPGIVVSGPEIGVAATVGKDHLLVSRLPKVVVVSTGDELIPIDQTPEAHQIRRSNAIKIQACLLAQQIPADTFHLLDEQHQIEEALAQLLSKYDVVILSGGVSKGKLDFIPDALNKLGVEKLFHRVKQRPGKPFWFGKTPNGVTVFAFPGNPVSSFMCLNRYFFPWLKASIGLDPFQVPFAKLQEDVIFKPDLGYFMQVRIKYEGDGGIRAMPIHGHGSGDLANLADADAFMELPAGKDLYKEGEVYRIFPFR